MQLAVEFRSHLATMSAAILLLMSLHCVLAESIVAEGIVSSHAGARHLLGDEEALLTAAKNGDLVELKRLVEEEGADLEARGPGEEGNAGGWTAMHWGAWNGDLAVVECLSDGGAIVIPEDDIGNTPLIFAVLRESMDVVEFLLGVGGDDHINAEGRDKRTALSWAAMIGNVGIEKALIDAGANLNMRDKNGWTALWIACRYGNLDLVNALIEADANVQMQDDGGWTALHVASIDGHYDAVKALLAAGANVNVVDNLGESVLDVALNKEIEEALRAAGATHGYEQGR